MVGSRTGFPPRWLPPLWLAAVSVTSMAPGVDDIERFNYFNNVAGPSAFVWGPGYFDLLPSIAGFAFYPLPLPAQVILHRAVALAAGYILYRELRLLFERWHAPRLNAPLLALAIVTILHGVEPSLLANLSWVHWSAFLAAVTWLLANVRTPLAPPGTAIAVTIGLLATPAGVLAVPLVLAGAATGALDRGRVIMAGTVVAWHGLQAMVWPEAWAPRVTPAWTVMAAQFASGEWRTTLAIPIASLLVVSAAFGRAARVRAHGLAEPAALCYLAWASLAALVSTRVVEQGIEPRYILIPAFCGAVAVVYGIGWLSPAMGRAAARGVVAVAAIVTLVMLNAERRGPIVLWWQQVQFTADAQEFRRGCEMGQAVSFEDEPGAIVIECRPQPRAPGEYSIVGARPKMGVYQDDVPVGDRPSVIVPERIF